MSMVCPQCGKTYEQRLVCQWCGVRLLFNDRGRFHRGGPGSPGRWRQKPWGRVLIGLALAQGLFYAVRQLLTGALLALEGEGRLQETWKTPGGLLLLEGLRLLTLLLGAMLAGGGQRRGVVLGALVGIGNGVLSVLVSWGPRQGLSTVGTYGQPLLQTVFGALGGWIGCAYWKPIPIAEVDPNRPARKQAGRRRRPWFAGRIAWFRVGLGITLAVAGTLSAGVLFDFVIDASQGKLSTTDEVQDRVITWEIKALALILGGAVAGATRSNGLKQGLAVAIGSSAILTGIQLNQPSHRLELALLNLISCFSLAILGGWFGSQLFPPILKWRRRRGLGPAA
jgi:DNA-directed RNA polymerase subunit RPC12/RpoP